MKPIHGDRKEFLKRYGYSFKEILDFSENINFLGPPPGVLMAIKNHLQEVAFYPDSETTKLKQALASYLSLKPQNLLLGNGSAYLIYLLASHFRPAQALVLAPTFCEYELAIEAYGGKTCEVKLDPQQGFTFDFNQALAQLGKVKMVFLANPNNPTANIFSRELLLDLVEQAFQRKIVVVVDEAFMDFVKEKERFSLRWEATERDNLVVLGSLTKFFALPGLRLGYLTACKDLINELSLKRGPWNVNTLAQIAGIAAVEDEHFIRKSQERVALNRDYFSKALSRVKGFRPYPSQTNFILVKMENSTSQKLQQNLAKKGIIIRDCSSFKGLDKHFIRLTVRKRKQNDQLISVLKEVA